MLIDLILDRFDGAEYDAREFYNEVSAYGDSLGPQYIAVARALDGGEEKDVKQELCEYVRCGGYNEEICDYINSVNWLSD